MNNDLISVSFEDRTNYIDYNNDDIIGIVITHCWGPSMALNVMDRSTFLRNYAIASPFCGPQMPNLEIVANTKRLFDMGAAQVEVVRLDNTSGHFCLALSPSKASNTEDLKNDYTGYVWEPKKTNIESAAITTTAGSPEFIIYLKYPGVPSLSEFPYERFIVELSTNVNFTGDIQIKIIGKVGEREYEIERWIGGLNPDESVDGMSYYIVDKVKNSDFISVAVNGLKSDSWIFEQGSGITLSYDITDKLSGIEYSFSEDTSAAEALAKAYETYFSDRKASNATVLVSTMRSKDIYKVIQEIAENRKNCTAIVGSTSFMKDPQAGVDYKKTLIQDKFSTYVNAAEKVVLFGETVVLDGTCGYAGRLAYVARTKKINQLPSADANGAYPNAALVDSWTYNEVLSAHENGITSIYNSAEGPQIFGVRSLHPRQMSYFGKFNISRVMSFILRDFYKEIDAVIHTDVVSDDVERGSCETRLNSILQSYAPANIKSNSYAYIASDEKDTKGGELLIIVAEIWFKKVVERVNLTIVATDSTVETRMS